MKKETTAQTPKLTDKVTPVEIAAFSCAGGGNGIGQYLYQNFGSYFYTNVVGLNPLVAGTMMSVCKIVDFFTDLSMGILVDHGKSKSGEKARPWLLRGILPYSLGIILMLSAPFNGGTASLVWAALTFVLATSICFTMNVIPFQSLMPMTTSDRYDRTKMEIGYALVTMVIMMACGMVINPLVKAMGGGKRGWFLTGIILAAVAFALHLFGYLGTKERIHVEKPKTEKRTMSVATELKYLATNKYYVLIVLATAFSGLNTMNASMIYYAEYVANNLNVLSFMVVLNMAPMLLMLFVTPVVVKKFNKRAVWVTGMAISSLSYIIMWAFKDVPVLLYIGLAMSSLGVGGITGTTMAFVSEAIDYGELKHGVRTVGIAFSLNQSLQKLFTALQSLLLGAMLNWGHFDSAKAVQPDEAVTAITVCFIVIPLITTLISLVCGILMDVEKKYPDMAEQLEAARAERMTKAEG